MKNDLVIFHLPKHSHRAKLHAFAAARAFIRINFRRTETALLERSRGTYTHRRTRMVLRAKLLGHRYGQTIISFPAGENDTLFNSEDM
jgi:hypothetical protein